MSTTTFHLGTPTLTCEGQPVSHCPDDLLERYEAVITGQRMSWTEHLHLTRRLGAGGQGIVYLSERRGTDNFTLPVALRLALRLHQPLLLLLLALARLFLSHLLLHLSLIL